MPKKTVKRRLQGCMRRGFGGSKPSERGFCVSFQARQRRHGLEGRYLFI